MKIEQIPKHEEVDKEFDFDHETRVLPIFEAAKLLEDERGTQQKIGLGFDAFSKIMNGGVTPGDLVVISGKSGHGKTFFSQTLCYNFNIAKVPQLFFSYEMEITEIANRFKEMGLNEQFLAYCPMKLKGGQIDWIEKKVNEAILRYDVKVVFIDHLGFLAPKLSGDNAERNFSVYLGQICRQLKLLALEKGIIIFLLAHVRKTREELDIDDIAHSSGVAQEADFVFMIERDKIKSSASGKTVSGEARRVNFFESDGEIFTKYSKIALVKNRRTGISKFIKCEVIDGRLQDVNQAPPIDPINAVNTAEVAELW